MCAGFAYTMVRRISWLNVSSIFIVFFFSAFSLLATAPYLIFFGHPMSAMQLAYLLLAGLAAAGGQFAITAAYKCSPAKEISVFEYSQILFSSLIGLIVFGQLPDKYSILGYIIIITMAILMFQLKRRTGNGEN